MNITANGIQINYELNGKGNSMVLIHGFSDNLTMWFNQTTELSKNYQVLAYDVRGHGQTQTPGLEFSMDLFADDLKELLKALKIEKACVLGYSMGGRIALQFALKNPDMVSGIVFANSGIIGPDFQIPAEQAKEMMERRQQMMDVFNTGDINLIADLMAERSLSPGLKEKNSELFNKYKNVKLKNDPEFYSAIMDAMMQSMTSPPDLSKLRCPALIIAGEYDGFMSIDVAKYMEKTIKDSETVIFPTGHASAIEVPELFNKAVLNFLKKLN